MERQGKSEPMLGAWIKDNGVQFGIYAEQQIGMALKLYNSKTKQCTRIYYLDKETYCRGSIYHIFVEDIGVGEYYTWHAMKENGAIGDVLMDPYGLGFEEIDVGCNVYYSVVCERKLSPDTRPKIKWEDTIIYELHIGGFTKGDEGLSSNEKGTIEGILTRIPHLKALGVTSIELLPVFKWNKRTLAHSNPKTGEKMLDIWGYNPIGFFALQEEYVPGVTAMDRINEFKRFVEVLHKHDLEVILDVVYNHTGEGGNDGTVFHFKVLDNQAYYKMEGKNYRNCTGTGNVLNTTHPITKQLIIDSLKYWVLEMGVDGFRFDLASTLGQNEEGEWIQPSLLDDIAKDPILRDVKLISESWDAKGSYNVGQMPYPFTEWSDRFRDVIRRFVKGDLGLTGDLAQCIEGREIYFQDDRKDFYPSIHFVTAHDGFTLWDLVSYNYKHNEDNGEDNRDGNNTNYSDNCGYEGDTMDEGINGLRIKRMKNYLTLLFISYGIPMLLMGDEIARSKKGNNNTYCQDNELLWLDWKEQNYRADLRTFIGELAKFRKEAKYLRNREKTVINWHGTKCYAPDWSYHSCSLACEIMCEEEHFYIIINSYYKALEFELPKVEKSWYTIIDTTLNKHEVHPVKEKKYLVEPHSVLIFSNKIIGCSL